jgi:hypothetical protein
VFNVHLEYSEKDSDTREKELRSLMSTLDRLLEKDPDAFNSNTANPDRKEPLFYANRAILFGDSNILPHKCGEHYWFVEALRKHYGYAVDVAMAATWNTTTGTMGMHDRMGQYGPGDIPNPFQQSSSWKTSPDHTSASVYPWWAATYRGKTGGLTGTGDRHDAIILIGKGWAYDDAVRDYKVMSDRSKVSPNNPSGGGVEMWRGGDSVTDGAGYAPNHDLGYGTTAGKPALHTDHRPITATLRIFVR